MHSYNGSRLTLSLFGSSHADYVGMTLGGIPAGLPVELAQLQSFLDRRAPGRSPLTTARKEADVPEFLSGVVNGRTDGGPITARILNQNVRRGDYEKIKDIPRPGHADFTARMKYGDAWDGSGGGEFSGRMTAPLCIAGGLCLQWLESRDIRTKSRLVSVGKATDPAAFEAEIFHAKAQGNSVGGIIECTVSGLPLGLGGPLFEGMEGRLSQLLFAIPGVKGVEFGSGFAGAATLGSQNNDPFALENGRIVTKTNRCGGILGGITTGGDLVFRVAVKPTPSIAMAQESVSLSHREPQILEITGRHDPCIALRALPVVEAAAAIGIFDALLENEE